jgi:hypothetical protein
MNEMNFDATDHGRGLGRTRFGALLAGLSATLFAALPSAGSEHGHPPGGGGIPTGSLSVGGDETVGTLPVIGGGQIGLPFTRGWRGLEPAFSVEGFAGDLSLVVRSAQGRGFISYEVIDAPTGRIRLAFHGDVVVSLDRELAANLPIDFGLAVPESYGSGRFVIGLVGERARSGRLQPGVLGLPVAALDATGLLEGTPLRIRTANAAGIRTSHTLTAADDLLILGQRD